MGTLNGATNIQGSNYTDGQSIRFNINGHITN